MCYQDSNCHTSHQGKFQWCIRKKWLEDINTLKGVAQSCGVHTFGVIRCLTGHSTELLVSPALSDKISHRGLLQAVSFYGKYFLLTLELGHILSLPEPDFSEHILYVLWSMTWLTFTEYITSHFSPSEAAVLCLKIRQRFCVFSIWLEVWKNKQTSKLTWSKQMKINKINPFLQIWQNKEIRTRFMRTLWRYICPPNPLNLFV